jgi:hypothetical protein
MLRGQALNALADEERLVGAHALIVGAEQERIQQSAVKQQASAATSRTRRRTMTADSLSA